MPEATVEQRASQLGWKPQEQFQGAPEKWVPAEEFLDRADHVMPILRENNRRLQGELAAETAARKKLEGAIADMRDSLEAMKEYQSAETERQVKKARGELLEQLKQAKTDGDVDLEVRLTSELSQVDADLRVAEDAKAAEKKEKEEKKPEQKPSGDVELPPSFLAWKDRNKWYGEDLRKTALANGIAAELRKDPANAHLVHDAFFERLDEELKAEFGTRGGSKVEGDTGGRPGGGSGGGKKSYAALPADAKAVCDRQEARMVGPNRAFKDQAAWRAHYATQYFAQES